SSAISRETPTRVTANASSSSVTSPPDLQALLRVDLAGAPRRAPRPVAGLAGRDRDLREPLRFLGSDALPPLPTTKPAGSGRRELAAALALGTRGYGPPGAPPPPAPPPHAGVP